MNKKFLLFVFLSFCFFEGNSQTTPSSAIRIYDTYGTPNPSPIGSEGPSGLGYGCALTHSRPTFLLIAPCEGGDIDFQADADARLYFQNIFYDTLSVVVWGPFVDTANISAKLTSANIVYCNNAVGTSAPTGSLFVTVTGNLDLESKSFYYMLLAASDSIFSYDAELGVLATSVVIDSPRCSICDGLSTDLLQEICFVTVDSTSGQNKIVWEKNDRNANGYVIYRKSSAGQFDSIGFVSENAFPTFIDTASSPGKESYTYEIGAEDSCNQVYSDGVFHTTMHLVCYAGTGGSQNLIWNKYSGNFSYSSFYIYRGPIGGPVELIDSIETGLETETYTDLNPPPGENEYQVRIHRVPACDPEFISGNGSDYSDISSNIASVSTTGISSVTPPNDVKLLPNPARAQAYLELGSLTHKIREVKIFSSTGSSICEINPGIASQLNLPVYDLPAGVYRIALIGDKTVYWLMLVKV